MSQPTDESVARLLKPSLSPEETALSAAEQQEAVAAVAAALASRRRTRTPATPIIWRRPTVWLAVAASLLIGIGVGRWASAPAVEGPRVETGFATLSNTRGSQLVKPGDTVEAEERLRTPVGGAVALRFSEGTWVSLEEKSDLTVRSVGPVRQFRLQEGRLEAQVVKLQPGERFRVETERAAIEVKGTHFTVDAQPSSATCPGGETAVTVQEGVVTVEGPDKAQRFLRAGEQYEVPCGEVKPPTPSTEAEPPPESPAPAEPAEQPVPAKTPATRIGKGTRAVPSPLAKMNSLYEQAMAARRAGDPEQAVALLRQLRAEFPAGQLDEAAAVEELRLLEKLDVKRARAAAARYLTEFPEGYAKDMAERLVAP